MKPAIIALLNKKGGVGKTSTCTHLAGALAQEGKRVLLVDNDPQGSLGRGFFGPEAEEMGYAFFANTPGWEARGFVAGTKD